jgi:uncharacterized membrane protein YfcA
MQAASNSTAPVAFAIDLSSFNVDLFALCIPVGFACGVAFATLAVSSWTLLVPVLLVAASTSPPNALFVCFVLDLGNGMLLALRYRRVVDWSAVALFATLAVICCVGTSLTLGIPFVRTHETLLRNGSTFGNYLGGLVFLARAAVQFIGRWRETKRARDEAAAALSIGSRLNSFVEEERENGDEDYDTLGRDTSSSSVADWSDMAEPPQRMFRRCCGGVRVRRATAASPSGNLAASLLAPARPRHKTGEFAVRTWELQAFAEVERPPSILARCCRMPCTLRNFGTVALVVISTIVIGCGAGMDGMGGGNAFAMVFIFILRHRSVSAAGTASAVSASMMVAMLIIYSATLAMGNSPRLPRGAPSWFGLESSGVEPQKVWRPLLLIGASDLLGLILGATVCTRLPERYNSLAVFVMFEGLAIFVTIFVRWQLTCTNFFCTESCPWPFENMRALNGICS